MAGLADLPRTKIVCTLGPASRDETTIERLMTAGASVFRLNFSHGTHDRHAEALHLIRAVAERVGRPAAVLQDLCGPKFRVGPLPDQGVTCRDGETLVIAAKIGESGDTNLEFVSPDSPDSQDWPVGAEIGDTNSRFVSPVSVSPDSPVPPRITTTYAGLANDVKPGDRILIDDGEIHLVVESVSSGDVVCRVSTGGLITTGKGVNLPGVAVSAPTTTEKDLADLAWGLDHGADYVAMSFVRTVDDVRRIQRVVHGRRSEVQVIAKIEKPEALDHIDHIINVADGLMVARGDLGVEMPLERVPIIQKDLIDRCHRMHKPVIVATQMLESMTGSASPTRAEVSDVANAVFDGADAVMLSGETAIGRYPVNACLTMARIARTAEAALAERDGLHRPDVQSDEFPTADAVCHGATRIATDLNARLVVVTTRSGTTGVLMSKQRLTAPVLAVSDNPGTVNRMCLLWGVVPMYSPTVHDPDDLLAAAEAFARDHGLADPGDTVVLVGGTRLGATGATDMLRVHRVAKSGDTNLEFVSPDFADVPADLRSTNSATDDDSPTTITTPAGTHSIDQSVCIQCGVCVQRCPMDVFRVVAGRIDIDPAAAATCLFDLICADSCPTAAITVTRAAS